MSSAIDRYYSGPYYYEHTNNIYVHLHSTHIGGAQQGGLTSADDVARILFKSRKDQALKASKAQFRTLFKNSLDENSAQLLSQVFEDDDLMTQLQTEMGEKFQEALSVDRMKRLMELQRSGVTSYDFIERILTGKVKNSARAFNELLRALSEAATLLNTDAGSRLAVFLSNEINQHPTFKNRYNMGKHLIDALNKFQQENNKVSMTELELEQIDQIIQTIKPLGRALTNIDNKNPNKRPTVKGVKKIAEDIFNTGFAESISAIIKETVNVKLDQQLSSVAKLTGADSTKIQVSDEFGNLLSEKIGDPSPGKADVMFDNIQIHLDDKYGLGGSHTITLKVGISDKFYKSKVFPGLSGPQREQTFGSGSGGNLQEALESLFGSNIRYLYYSYNTLAHGNDKVHGWNIAQDALNQVILTRQVIRLFSARGGNADFAQFMFINGQIVPIWSIIMSTVNDISKSSSEEGSERQPLTLSIPDRGDIQTTAQTFRNGSPDTRIYAVNQKIKKARIYAHVNLNYLKF